MYKTCLVLGKFMPPHKGHEYLIRFAQTCAKETHVVVDCLATQTIPVSMRVQWIKEQIPSVNVHGLTKFMPQTPEENPLFWEVWKKELLSTLGFTPDVVVAAMDYGKQLATVLGCDFIPLDIARETFSISATQLRENIWDHWDFLIDSAKPHYIRKLCLVGPESTGKSTLGTQLAKDLNTVYVPEYAKAFIAQQQGIIHDYDLLNIAKAQCRTESALARFTNKIMVCDSSALTTKVFAEALFPGQSFPLLDALLQNHRYDHYALFYPDTPFISDVHRQVLTDPEGARLSMFERFEALLQELNFPYTVLRGSFCEKRERLLELSHSLTSTSSSARPAPLTSFT